MVGRLVLAVCILAVLATQVTTARADEDRIVLPIPYRSQFDGSYYEGANCGPASMGMILEGFGGQPVSTAEVRALTNKLQGSEAWDGVHIYNLALVPGRYGMQVDGLYQGNGYRTWTAKDVRDHIRQGHVVVPEVRYRYLPGHEGATIWDDHYIIILGLIGDNFVYHDSAFRDGIGAYRTISESQLMNAMARSEFPRAAFAVIPPPPPPPSSPPSPAPTPVVPALSAPGHGDAQPEEVPTPMPGVLFYAGEFESSQEQELSASAANPEGSPALQMGLALTGLLSLVTIGVTVSRRW